MRLILTTMASAALFMAAPGLSSDAFAHGGAYRGPAGDVSSLDLPEGCEPDTEVTYTAVCVGPQGDGAEASCTVVCPVIGTPFIRGDCNQDGEVCGSVSDIVRMLEICVFGVAETTCPAACDANGDGEFCGSLSDMLYVANYCFTGLNEAPPAPFPECGIDTESPLGCEGVTACSQ